jgi:TolA-binding protein
MMGRRILAIGLTLPLLCLAACGGSRPAQPTATADPALLDSRMKQMQADLEQMRQQQLQMQQQQEQQRQQQLQLLYQQRQAAAAAGAPLAPAGGLPPGASQASAPPPPPPVNRDYLPAFHFYDPSDPEEKPDKRGNDQKL